MTSPVYSASDRISIVSFIASWILKCIGWDSDLSRLSNMKGVLIYPHTSNWDFVITLIYLLANPHIFERTYYLMKPQLFENTYVASILSYFHAIPSSKLEESGNGTVDRVSNFLNTKKDFLFLISPEGRREKSHWRSGYRRIAEKTGSKIIIGGLDYVKHRFISVEPRSNSEADLQYAMGEIVSLYPEDCYTTRIVGDTSIMDYFLIYNLMIVISVIRLLGGI
jgi:hypothetical protein